MKKYVGARWLGKYPVKGRPESGIYIEPDGMHRGMREAQAIASRQWEPVYEVEVEPKKKAKIEKGEES